jgi:hypothetical protein
VNTVLESLAQGVPQVAIPVSFDQPGIAARIAYHKTGVVTSLDKLTAIHLSTLLGEVLNDATYRDNARRIQKAIVKANGLSAAADLVEESLKMTRYRCRDVALFLEHGKDRVDGFKIHGPRINGSASATGANTPVGELTWPILITFEAVALAVVPRKIIGPAKAVAPRSSITSRRRHNLLAEFSVLI